MEIDNFIEEITKLGINYDKKKLNQLEKYYELLVEWNKFMNLTGITEKKEVYLKHFYDSLTICKSIDLNNFESLCDVGTGAGFPGIVLKIFFPNLNIVLIDSLNKRINFLNEVIKELGLENITIIHSRIEEYGLKNREQFDIVTARAVAPLNVLLEYCVPLVKVNGYFVALKGNIEEEINNSKNALVKLDCSIDECLNFKLPIENSNRSIVRITKKIKTNKIFPRKYSEIKKNPL